EEVLDEIRDHLSGVNMVFVTAGMGGGTGTGAAPVIAKAAREAGILTVGVVTKPFHFEGQRRMRIAENGITELHKSVDTLLIIPNQNLFRVANEKTTFADAFAMADQVLYSGVACITDLMVKEGLINLDFADVRMVMREMGKAMMGTGEAEGDKRALTAAVLATGSDEAVAAQRRGAPPNSAAAGASITEIAEVLRKENQHILDRIERSEQPRTIMQPLRAATPAPAAPVAAAAPASINASIESAARVAIESAVQDVNIRPLSLNPSLLLQ